MTQHNTSHALNPACTSGLSPPPAEDERLDTLLSFLEDFAAFCVKQYLSGALDSLEGEADR